MISLKAFLPTLSEFLELSPAAIYERQRALVRLQLLPTPLARGRNSGGAMATPRDVSMVLIAVLATDNLSDIDDSIGTFANLQSVDRKTGKVRRYELTGETTFAKSLTAILDDCNLAEHVKRIEFARKAMTICVVEEEAFLGAQFGRPRKFRGVELKAIFSEVLPLARELERIKR